MVFSSVKRRAVLIWSLSTLSSFPATNKVGVIVGAVIGALLLLLLLLLLIWLLICCCHKRRYEKEVANEIRYCIRVGKHFKHPWNDLRINWLRPVWPVSSGRTLRPRRADPPAETPASAQCWATTPTPGCTTAQWGNTCPASVNLVMVSSTQAGIMGYHSQPLQGKNLLHSNMTIDTDTRCNYNTYSW